MESQWRSQTKSTSKTSAYPSGWTALQIFSEANHLPVAFRMLDDLTDDVDEAQERMNFVMGRLSKMLKTKGVSTH
ncbi:unnamed protein product [Phytophthora fragariaefolia]|uniref:Unnamed protein product n=1 Tax=Phytophthora fragariaefolia TaxID=1490495 RepID=A0A9W6YDD4_9STRA|nr:unnamed protein product [Phytophthora fragariaefolia]